MEKVRANHRKTEVGRIPKNWEIRRVGKLLSGGPKNGYSGRTGEHASGTATLSLSATSQGRFVLDGETIKHLEGKVPPGSDLFLKAGDVLIQRSNTPDLVGTAALYPGSHLDLIYPDLMSRLRFREPANAVWFWRYANSNRGRQYFRQVAAGSSGSMPKITGSNIRKMPIPLREQRAIAAALSDVDALIEKLDALVAKKRAIKTGAMQALLTGEERLPGFSGAWETKRLGKLADMSSGGTPLSSVSSYYGGEIAWASVSDLGNAGSRLSETERYLTKEGLQSSAARIYPAGTVLYAMYASIGETSIAAKEMSSSQAILGIRTGRALENEFLYYLLCQRKEAIQQMGQQGTQSNLNAGMVRGFRIPLPPLAEQRAIAEVLAGMDAAIEALQARRAKTQAVKEGMMQELLTGKTRLVDPEQVAVSEQQQRQEEEASESSHNWAIDEAVLIGILAEMFGSRAYPLARKRRTKLMYLLYRYAKRDTSGFLKKPAGPYNPETRYGGPEKIAEENGYVEEVKSTKLSYEGFVSGEKQSEAEAYFVDWYGADARRWLEQFQYEKTDQLEVLTTVDVAVQELRQANREATLDAVKKVIAESEAWRPKLDREVFSDENIEQAMRKSDALFGS